MSKILDSVVELNKIQYIAGNNALNFTATPIGNGAPIVDATAGIYANGAFAKANAAFESANNVAPQIQPAFAQANAAFNKANSAVSRQSFLANTGQTLFITNGYNIGYVDVFVNGIKLYSAEDFTATDGANVSILQPTITQNDVVEIINWGGTAEPIARVDQYARDYVNTAWNAANSAYNFANSVYGLANNAANSAASSIPISGSSNISGNLTPVSTNTYYLGSDTNRWHSLYVGPGSIDIGGLKLSNVGGTLSVATPGSPAVPIAGEDIWVRAQANAAFAAANSVNVYGANTAVNSFFALPIGTTAQRPAAAANGAIRYNTTLGRIEGYLYSSGWVGIISDSITVEYLVIAGGGGGGGATRGGGAGAGGYISSVQGEMSGGGVSALSTLTLNSGTYTVVVGAGGSTGTYTTGDSATQGGSNGSTSSFGGSSAVGGGGGGASDSAGPGRSPQAGGSGGGGWYGDRGSPGAAGTTGQGYPGGISGGSPPYGAGGGGAGGAGYNFNSGVGGRGGIGVESSITGIPTYRAGGGSSSDYNSDSNYPGGAGGGGIGRNASGTPMGTSPSNGTTNTGGGGGASGNGGSGVVIIRYLGSQRATGGTVASTGGYTIHTFTGSGSFIV